MNGVLTDTPKLQGHTAEKFKNTKRGTLKLYGNTGLLVLACVRVVLNATENFTAPQYHRISQESFPFFLHRNSHVHARTSCIVKNYFMLEVHTPTTETTTP